MAGLKIPKENISFIGNKSFASDELKTIFRSAGTVTAQLPPQFMDTYNNDRIVHASSMLLAFYRNRGFVKASGQSAGVRSWTFRQRDDDFGAENHREQRI